MANGVSYERDAGDDRPRVTVVLFPCGHKVPPRSKASLVLSVELFLDQIKVCSWFRQSWLEAACCNIYNVEITCVEGLLYTYTKSKRHAHAEHAVLHSILPKYHANGNK